MSRADLQGGSSGIDKRFHAPWRIARRLARWLTMPSGLASVRIPLLLNVAYWGRQFRFHVRGYNPARAGRPRLRAPGFGVRPQCSMHE